MKFAVKKEELFTIPNILGYIRIVLLPVIGICILKDYRTAKIVLLIFSALTDFLDGKIARKFHQVTEFGKALDPVADKLTLCVLFAFLAWKNPYVRVIAVSMIAKEGFMLMMQFITVKKTGKTTGGAFWYGKICTAVSFVTLILYLLWDPMPEVYAILFMGITCLAIFFAWLMYAVRFYHLLSKR